MKRSSKRHFIALSCCALAALAASSALAGQESHGGGVIACTDGEISLLDLFEGRAKGLEIPRDPAPVEAQVEKIFKKLEGFHPYLGKEVRHAYREALKLAEDLPVEEALPPPTDTLIQKLPAGCHLEGAALWYDGPGEKDRLVVDRSVLARLEARSPTEAAALWVHEAIYRVFRHPRDSGQPHLNIDKDSVQSRLFTSFLFSTRAIPSVFTGVPDESVLECGDESHPLAIVYLTDQGGIRANLLRGLAFPDLLYPVGPAVLEGFNPSSYGWLQDYLATSGTATIPEDRRVELRPLSKDLTGRPVAPRKLNLSRAWSSHPQSVSVETRLFSDSDGAVMLNQCRVVSGSKFRKEPS
jgi:hypothetical protein